MKYFFEHIYPLEDAQVIMIQNTNSIAEADELLDIARSSVHHKVLDLILSEVPVQYQENLIGILTEQQNGEKIISQLKVIIDNFEQKVEKAAKEAELEIIKLISEI